MTTNENNPCTCTTPEYTIILNQQGPSGRQGEAGQDGFSPIVSVQTNTPTNYTLTITSADGTITTPNLRAAFPSGGSNGQVLTNFGNDVYGWSELPSASENVDGVVTLATISDFSPDTYGDIDDTKACTPQSVVDYVNTLDVGGLANIKDITNGVQIMGFEEVPPTGKYYRPYFQFTAESGTQNYTAQYILEDWENNNRAGTQIRNILTDYTVTAGTGITVSRKNNGVEIGSATGNLKYSTLTSTEYSELTPNPDTMYRLTDTNGVHLGTIDLTGGGATYTAGDGIIISGNEISVAGDVFRIVNGTSTYITNDCTFRYSVYTQGNYICSGGTGSTAGLYVNNYKTPLIESESRKDVNSIGIGKASSDITFNLATGGLLRARVGNTYVDLLNPTATVIDGGNAQGDN